MNAGIAFDLAPVALSHPSKFNPAPGTAAVVSLEKVNLSIVVVFPPWKEQIHHQYNLH